ncbi:MAG: hypothetical protein PHX80_05250 [Candidatus Nanoarchaeia archaeon]|nr:hypothetical protein [Candidatus Nanoarchaeia archaeon]
MNNIKQVVENAKAFCKEKAYGKGFVAGDGEYWIKCDGFEVACNTKLSYIFFIFGDEITIYQC